MYSEDIAGLVEREEVVKGKVEALRVESERLLGMAGDVSGRCKRVESEVVELKRASVNQVAEWKGVWMKADRRVDEVSEQVKEWTSGWSEERKANQATLQRLVSGQHGQEEELAALRAELDQLRQSLQHQHSPALFALKETEEQKDGAATSTETKEAADDMDQAETFSTAASNNEEDARELASSSHFTEDGPALSISTPHDTDSSSAASPFLRLSPTTTRSASNSLSISSSSALLPAPNRSHSISLPASPSDLSSVFPSVSLERQAGVFTSPAKVVQSTHAMAWTINVKDGGKVSGATPPPRHSVGGAKDSTVTPRSAGGGGGGGSGGAVHRHSGSAGVGSGSKSGGGGSGGSGRGSLVGSGRSSVSGSSVSSPHGKVSRQLAAELDEDGANVGGDGAGGGEGGGSGGDQPAADVIVSAADGQLNGDAAIDVDDETY